MVLRDASASNKLRNICKITEKKMIPSGAVVLMIGYRLSQKPILWSSCKSGKINKSDLLFSSSANHWNDFNATNIVSIVQISTHRDLSDGGK